MKIISEYSIYCTKEQTEKALTLGAKIKELLYTRDFLNAKFSVVVETNYLLRHYEIPTADQMIGWLRSLGIYIIVPIPLIKDFNKNDFSKADAFEYRIVINGSEPYSGEYLTPEEATIAAIDAALKYLTENKKK